MYDIEHLKDFGNKLLKLVEYNHPDITKDSDLKKEFIRNYDKVYPHYKDDEKKSVQSLAYKWFSGEQTPSLEKLCNICNLYDVDIEYFIANQVTMNKENKSSAENLGLDTIAIERIKNYEYTKNILEALIWDNSQNMDYLEKLLDEICNYILLTSSSRTTISVSNSAYKYHESFVPNKADKSILRYNVMSALNDCLDIKSSRIDEIITVTHKTRKRKQLEKETDNYIKTQHAQGVKYKDMLKKRKGK